MVLEEGSGKAGLACAPLAEFAAARVAREKRKLRRDPEAFMGVIPFSVEAGS
jgi:hypothetical protein